MGIFLPAIQLLTADAPSLLSAFPQQWGIFSNGGPVLVSDAVASLDYERAYDVSDAPQEQGAFESYNKVQHPFEATVTILSSLTRFQLFNILEPAVASLQIVSVVMPEITYPSANLLSYKFRRTVRNGVTLVAVDVRCREIRFSVATSVAGTNRPVGQTSSGSDLSPGSSSGTGNSTATPAAPAALPSAPGSSIQQGSSASASADLATGSGDFFVPGSSALDTGSTNAASPVSSGPVQSISGSATITPATSDVPPDVNTTTLTYGVSIPPVSPPN